MSNNNGKNGHSSYVSLRGVVFDLGAFMPAHVNGLIDDKTMQKYAGKDVSNLFPVQVSAMCQGKDPNRGISKAVQLGFQPVDYQNMTADSAVKTGQDANAQYHDFRWAYKGSRDERPSWLTWQMLALEDQYYKGTVAYSPQYIKNQVDPGKTDNPRSLAYINKRVYDMSDYIRGGIPNLYPANYSGPKAAADASSDYMDNGLVNLFSNNPGKDITQEYAALDMDPALRQRMQICLDNLFFAGNLDTRNSTQCLFANYLLLAISILLVSVIGFKFFAALQFGKKNVPEHLDKFVICTVPVYTEDEDSLRRAIDSAARMKYDDKRKLLLVVCDGMIIGQGNDRPTPRIVLDILGVPDTVDPEPLSFESLGEGMKQHNMGKVYSGLYEVQGHIVPFLVVVKIGKPSEVSRWVASCFSLLTAFD